jgi:TamB, inner membrane protein subunit of TAM complex
LTFGIILSIPSVQTWFAKQGTIWINEKYGTDIAIDEVTVTGFGHVKIKKIFIKDYKNDTLVYAKTLNTNLLDVWGIYKTGDLLFGDIRLDGLVFNLKNYKGEKDNNLDKFIEKFDSGSKSSKSFLLTANNVFVTNSRFMLTDENRENPKDLDLKNWTAKLENFSVSGPNINTDIKKMSFLDHRGLFVDNLSSIFSYTKKQIRLEKLDILTNESIFKGHVVLNYERKDFADFNNKVNFDIKIDKAKLATNDIFYFYKEIGRNQQFNLKANIKGTLNNLAAINLNLSDKKNTQIIGNVNFKNLFGKGENKFYMKGNFEKVTSNYDNLSAILPNVLGKKLPSSLKKLGQFNIVGDAEVTTNEITTNFAMTSSLGNVKSDLIMKNIENIDNASYKGNIVLENFKIGSFLNRTDVETISMDVDVDGRGFTQKYLKTRFSGTVDQIKYNGYNYKNIVVDGNFEKPFFKGRININDPNLKMDFDGIVDLNKSTNVYDFDTKIQYADLNKLNFFNDSIANFKGNIKMKVSGTNLDNFVGKVYINNTTYQNKKSTYIFDDFEIQSSFDENLVRTIKINSPDIIDGKMVGKFKFNQLQKMLENSIGSLYTNYRPNKIIKGQFFKFDFSLNNKIIEIFYPGISISENTKFHGSINSDIDEFKFNINSPKIVAYENSVDNINVEIDNKNPLYNAYVQVDSIRTKYYKVRDFSLINITQKDTLFVRSEFKGGDRGEDSYNLNLFHTINKDNNNVVGIRKSEVKFKESLWYLNEKESKDNTVVFDKLLKNFNFDNLIMSHENEFIALNGDAQGKLNKDLKLNFNEVDLHKILPSIDKFKIDGILNGGLNVKQANAIYQPTALVTVDGLSINKILLGKLNLDIEGDDSLTKFEINSSVENKNIEAFSAKGNLSVINKKTVVDLDLNFDKFNLGVLDGIGGTVITNIRGFASGNAKVIGNVDNPDMNGRLYLDDSGVKIPYLNVNYLFNDNTVVDVTRSKFIIKDAELSDTIYHTQGILNGFIQHKNFGDWKLDLNLDSRNLIALDTYYNEDSAYYGKAFIDGNATISGPISSLFINVNAKSNKNTSIKIPIGNGESVSSNSYIHFVTENEKKNIKSGTVAKSQKYDGVEMNFDLDITPDAEVEIIINKDTDHKMIGNGIGSLNLSINTLGKFNMTGDIAITKGKYFFKYAGLVDKQFDVKKNGSISWTGDPLKADLNLEATYSKLTANPGVLIENSTLNKKVPVIVTIGINGNLSNPEPDFSIDFPSVNGILKSEIQTKLSDKDTRQKQAIVLLSTGGFLSDEGLNQAAAYNNLYEKASSLFGDLFQDQDSKIKFDVVYAGAERTIGQTANTGGKVNVAVTSQISERVYIKGQVGVPVGGVNESGIVGNVELQYRVNEDGTLNVRVFNRENEINYIGEGIGYTQGLGISYEVDFDTFNEFVNKVFKSKKNPIENKEYHEHVSDSEIAPTESSPVEEKKKEKLVPKPNNEAKPVDDD